MSTQLDTIDWRILSILMTDGRMSNVEIARQIGSSEGTVRRRIQNLIDQGVMEVVAVADPEKIGLGTQIIMGVDAELGRIHQVAQALAALKPIRYVAYTAGRYDFIAEAYFTSKQELFEFLTDEIPKIPGILDTETLRILKVAKHNWHYLPDSVFETD